MSKRPIHAVTPVPSDAPTGAETAGEDPVVAWGAWLAERPPAQTEAANIDRLQAYRVLRGQLAAAEAAEIAALEESRLTREAAEKVPKAERGAGLAAEIALARAETPARGYEWLATARALRTVLPNVRAALRAGRIRAEHAHRVVKAINTLTPGNQQAVDAALADRLGSDSPAALAKAAKAHAQTLDGKAATARHKQAAATRNVRCEPAGDGMATLIAYGPAQVIHTMYGKLTGAAKQASAKGQAKDPATATPRKLAQLSFDLLAQWCTGDASPESAAKVELQVMMTPASLLGTADTAAWLAGHGPIPAEVARTWLADPELEVLLRRLFTSPDATQLVGLESRARKFHAGLRRMLLLRDPDCRTPWCEQAPTQGDHATPHARGGPTSLANGQMLCPAHNQIKESRGWSHDSTAKSLKITTPTGHEYQRDNPPILPGQEHEKPLKQPASDDDEPPEASTAQQDS